MRTLDTRADLRSLYNLDADTKRITRGFDTYGSRLAAYYKGLYDWSLDAERIEQDYRTQRRTAPRRDEVKSYREYMLDYFDGINILGGKNIEEKPEAREEIKSNPSLKVTTVTSMPQRANQATTKRS